MPRRLVRSGLLAVLAIAIGVAVVKLRPRPAEVDVTMVDDRFMPARLTFKQGVLSRLRLTNRGKHTHEFTAPTFFATAEIDNPGVLNREHTEIVVGPGESKDLLLTARRPGTYDLRCSDHDWDGMIGGIVVE